MKQIWQCLQMSSQIQYENTLLNAQYLFWWLPERDRYYVDDNLCESLYMPSISFPCWQSPQCFQCVLSLVWSFIAFCDEPARWQTTVSIFLHMGFTISGICGSFRRFFLEVIKIGVSINILNNTRNQAWFGQ